MEVEQVPVLGNNGGPSSAIIIYFFLESKQGGDDQMRDGVQCLRRRVGAPLAVCSSGSLTHAT